MFTIIGGDGKEYGPVTTEQVRTWINAGRANLETQAKALGSEEWRPLRDYAEFSGSVVPPLVAAPAGAGGGFSPSAVPDSSVAASRGTRIAAAIVNAFFYFLCTIPGSLVMSRKLIETYPELAEGKLPRLDEIDPTLLTAGTLYVWAGIGAGIALQALLLALRGQNLGKLMFGLQVLNADTGTPAGAVRASLLRFVLPVTLIIVLNVFTAVIGFLFLLVDFCFIFREDGRCLHDLIAGTKVGKKQ